MKKFLIGLFTGLVLALLTGVILFFSVLRLGDRKIPVADGTTIVLKLHGDIPEKPPVEFPVPFIGGPAPPTVRDVWSLLERAASDSRVKAVLVVTGDMDTGWAKANEIRDSILKFKKSGKPVYAFVRSPGSIEYYLATAADKVFASPEDILDVKGLRAELAFFKGTLDKLGVEMEIHHVGKYKDAGDMFTQRTASPETREVINSLLDGIFGTFVQTVAQARKKTPDEVRALIDRGPFTGDDALKSGLVDALRFEDQVEGELKTALKQNELKKMSHRDYLTSAANEGGKKIAFLVGDGAIIRGSGEDAMGSDEAFSSGAFIRLLRRVASDKDVQGVIMRVDSPGGDAIASDEILREVKLLRDKKPLVISMSDAAASGGYYVAMTGDPILAYPNTITGSIGIIYGKANLRGLYDKIGVHKDIMTRGANAAIDSDYGPLTESGKQKLRETLEDFYKGFVGKAAASRKKSYDQLEPLAQGRVWLGSQAKANGLIDELGGIDKAIEMIRKQAKIPADEKIRLEPYPGRRNLLEQWLKSSSEQNVEAKVRQYLGFDPRVFAQSGYLRMLPYQIKIW
jgi:protease IV